MIYELTIKAKVDLAEMTTEIETNIERATFDGIINLGFSPVQVRMTSVKLPVDKEGAESPP